MANIKISELPTYTGSTTGAYIVMDNSSLTESFKVTKETFLSGLLSPATVGTWTLSAGVNTYSFTVPSAQSSYVMTVYASIPNGIIVWFAQVTLSNTNVAALGAQYAWFYNGGGSPITIASIPQQIVGIAGTTIGTSPAVSDSRVFEFQFGNSSGSPQVVNYSFFKTN
jgi:hypothetical protein